jgi:hypothetical protein
MKFRSCWFGLLQRMAAATVLMSFLLVASAFAANPVPQLVGPVKPQAVVPGSAGFTLTAYGANFVSGAVVNWNGKARSTTFISARELQAQILTSDVAKPTAGYITVTNPPPGGGKSSSSYALVEVHQPTKTIVPGAMHHYGQQPDGKAWALVAADFNDDGVLDLVSGDGSGKMPMLLGNGDGTFHFGSVISRQFFFGSNIPVGDFNGDGELDLAFMEPSNGPPTKAQVDLGDGDGRFRLGSRFGNGGAGGGCFCVAADFNRDGNLDLLVDHHVYLGNGDGTFRLLAGHSVVEGFSVALGNFDGDGKLDLVIERFNGVGYEIDINLGNGDGTFQKARQIAKVSRPSSIPGVLASDFNGDGKLDLAYLDGERIVILIGNGDGTFQSPAYYSAFGAFTTGDFNSDGDTDLLVNGGDNATFVLLGKGDGTFRKAQKVNGLPDSGEGGIIPGDFNSDGLLDFVFQEGGWGITVHLQQ